MDVQLPLEMDESQAEKFYPLKKPLEKRL